MRLAVIQKNEAKRRKKLLIMEPFLILLCRHIFFQGDTKVETLFERRVSPEPEAEAWHVDVAGYEDV